LDDNLFNDGWNLHYFFNNFVHWNKFLNNPVNRNWDLNWNNDLSFDLHNFRDLDMVVDDLFDWDISWNLFDYFNHSFLNQLVVNDFLLNSL